MSYILKECPECKSQLRITFGQNTYGGRVNYFEEHHCNNCKYAGTHAEMSLIKELFANKNVSTTLEKVS